MNLVKALGYPNKSHNGLKMRLTAVEIRRSVLTV